MKLVAPAVLAAATLASVAFAFTQRRHKQQRAYTELMTGLAQPQRYRNAPIVVVVDVGSSSIRASCFAMVHRDGNAVEWVLLNGSLQQVQNMDCIDVNGEADIHQIATKVESVVDGALRFLRATQLTSKIVGVGFSTFAMNILGINEKVCLCMQHAHRRQIMCVLHADTDTRETSVVVVVMYRANRSRQCTRYGSLLSGCITSGTYSNSLQAASLVCMMMTVRRSPSVDGSARAKASRAAHHARIARRVPRPHRYLTFSSTG